MKHILLLLSAFLLLGCTSDNEDERRFLLHGAWTLSKVEYPYEYPTTYFERGNTILRTYDGDSVMYQCWLTETESALVIKPEMQCPVTLIDKGGGTYIYIEEDNPRPLTIFEEVPHKGDQKSGITTITIQQDGVLYTWHRADDIAKEWSAEIREIIAADKERNGNSQQNYVLSVKERSLVNIIHVFICSTIAIVILMLLIARIAHDNRMERRRLQMQIQQIQEIQENRPPIVRQAVKTVETEFFDSDDYHLMQQRIATGQHLKEKDWADIETLTKRAWPGFCNQLRSLYPLSELEYHACQLIKLRIPPTDIAAVLARSNSTISTMRSRLYQKVFGCKGGAREWDEFLLSIGA